MISETLQARVARIVGEVRAERPGTESGFQGRELDYVLSEADRRGVTVDELLAESDRLAAAQVAADRRLDDVVTHALRVRHPR